MTEPVKRPRRFGPTATVWALTVLAGAGLASLSAETNRPAASNVPAAPRGGTGGGSRQVDMCSLRLRGDGHGQDSFSLTVQAVAAVLGKRVGYERLLALSGNGFAPAYRRDESCTAWWGMYDRDRSMDLVGRAVGLRFRLLPKPPEGIALPEARKHAAGQVREAMAAGQVVITDGGWNVFTPSGLNPWCWWGVVTEAEEDGTIQGACLNGRTDNLIEWPYSYWGVSPAEPELSEHEADVQMLRRAVARIRGDRKPFLSGGTVFGLGGLDLWMQQLEKVPFCPDCKDKSIGCLVETARPTYEDSPHVAGHLRARAEAFSPAARPHLAAAAGHYDRVRALLAPAFTGKGGDHYNQIVNDTKKQKEHAKVVARIKAEMAAASEEITQALAAEGAGAPAPAGDAGSANPKAVVKREGGKVWIEGVPPLAWGKQDCTYAGSMAAALAVTDRPVGYADVMGFSGLAFRVRWWQRNDRFPGWCPSTAVGEFPEEIAATARAIGWRLDVVDEMANEANPRMERYASRITASIDAGKPVPAYLPDMNLGVVYGYEEGGKALRMRSYIAGDKPLLQPVEKLGPMLILLWRRTEPLSRRDALVEAMKIAVANWGRPLVRIEKGGYYYGAEALETWRADLAAYGQWDDKQRASLFFLNWWNFDMLATSREAAGAFLRSHADALTGEARVAVERAAGLYETEYRLIAPVFEKKVNAFLGPWSGKTPKDWTAAVRKREVQFLTMVQRLDEAAIAELAKALKAAGAGAPPAAPATRPVTAPATEPAAGGKRVVLEQAAALAVKVNEELEKQYVQPRDMMAMRLTAMRIAGRDDADYETLIMLWGFGTSWAYHPRKYWLMYQPVRDPEATERFVQQATGFGWKWTGMTKDADKAWEILKASTDAGQPIQGSWIDQMLFVGYQDAARPADRKAYVLGGFGGLRWMSWADFAKWASEGGDFGRHTKPVGQAPAKDTAVEIMRLIVRCVDGDPRAGIDWMKDGTFGQAGLAAYAADIADLSKQPDYWDAAWLGCHGARRQLTGRKCAAAWLRGNAGLFPKQAAGYMLAAAKEYDAACDAWQEWEKHLGLGAGDDAKALEKAWREKPRRQAGAAAIRQAAAREKLAAAQIAKALEAIGPAKAP